MKILHYSIFLLGFMWLISSCSKNSKKCGGDNKDGVTGWPNMNAANFKMYKNMSQTYVDGKNFDDYLVVNGGEALFIFVTHVENVCPFQDATAYIIFSTKLYDPNMRDTFQISSPGGNIVTQAVQPSGLLNTDYNYDVIYPFTTQAVTNYTVENTIYFPSHGSWTADSIYFFRDILDAMQLSSSFKKN